MYLYIKYNIVEVSYRDAVVVVVDSKTSRSLPDFLVWRISNIPEKQKPDCYEKKIADRQRLLSSRRTDASRTTSRKPITLE